VHRVLLVEDNPADQRLFHLAAEANGTDCEVITADDGDRALAYLMTGGQADLMVLDWRLVRTDGGETLRRLRSSTAHAAMRVIVFSSSQSPAELAYAQEMGAGWFRKPIDTVEYFKVVGQILSSIGGET
jgi:CheY-like chemotaxis protein